MDKASQEQRVEELSRQVGGRFALTSLVQKQMRDYVLGGRTFMPDVAGINELFNYILDEVEDKRIELAPPEQPAELPEGE